MKAVILAAGRGTRMGELTRDTPKPLLKIGGKNLIEYKIEALPSVFDEVILIIGYQGEKIRDYFKDKYDGKRIRYVESDPLGTGYAVWEAKEYLTERFMVLCGDDLYSREDIEAALSYPHSALVHVSESPISGGSMVVDEEGCVHSIVEGSHPAGALIATGLYVLSPDIFSYPLVKIAGRGEYGLPQTILPWAEKNPLKAVFAKHWKQITAPEDLLVDESDLLPFQN